MVTALIAIGADVGRRCLPRPISVRLGLLGYVLSLPYLLYRRIRDGPREHPNDAEAQNDFEMKEKSLENENAELRNRLESTQKEGDILRNEEQYLKSEIQNLKTKLQASEEQKEDALRRLSELISVRLRDNNPNIADLNDPYRPTKLAEISSELYDNEWTEAFDVLEKSYSEEESIAILLDIVMNAFTFCKKTIEDQWTIVLKWYVSKKEEDQETMHRLKENMKSKVNCHIPEIAEKFRTFLITITANSKLKNLLSDDNEIKAYVSTCVKLCVYMSVQDPPCVMQCPGWLPRRFGTHVNTEDGMEQGENTKLNTESKFVLDKNLFREYTKSGKFISFIVWPILYLYDGGPVLCKGVAQGCND